MKNKQAKQMMIDVENVKQGFRGFKTSSKLGWHGFNELGLFHCSGSNFIWICYGMVSLKAEQLKN